MRKIIKNSWLRLTTVFLFCCFSFVAFAQDKGIKVDVDIKKDNEWYRQPWAWVVGGAVFILLLVALLRGGSKKTA